MRLEPCFLCTRRGEPVASAAWRRVPVTNNRLQPPPYCRLRPHTQITRPGHWQLCPSQQLHCTTAPALHTQVQWAAWHHSGPQKRQVVARAAAPPAEAPTSASPTAAAAAASVAVTQDTPLGDIPLRAIINSDVRMQSWQSCTSLKSCYQSIALAATAIMIESSTPGHLYQAHPNVLISRSHINADCRAY